jgi:hypothetical protein
MHLWNPSSAIFFLITSLLVIIIYFYFKKEKNINLGNNTEMGYDSSNHLYGL